MVADADMTSDLKTGTRTFSGPKPSPTGQPMRVACRKNLDSYQKNLLPKIILSYGCRHGYDHCDCRQCRSLRHEFMFY